MGLTIKTFEDNQKKLRNEKKTILKQIDKSFSVAMLEVLEYGIENKRCYRCILAVVQNLSKKKFIQ